MPPAPFLSLQHPDVFIRRSSAHVAQRQNGRFLKRPCGQTERALLMLWITPKEDRGRLVKRGPQMPFFADPMQPVNCIGPETLLQYRQSFLPKAPELCAFSRKTRGKNESEV